LRRARALCSFADEGRVVASNEDQKSIPGKRWFSNLTRQVSKRPGRRIAETADTRLKVWPEQSYDLIASRMIVTVFEVTPAS